MTDEIKPMLSAMDRKQFLRAGLVALCMAPFAPRFARAMVPRLLPVIYPDDVGDSTDGLQAVLDGRSAWDAFLGRIVGGPAGTAIVHRRVLRTTRPLVVEYSPRGPLLLSMSDCYIHGNSSGAFLEFRNYPYVTTGCLEGLYTETIPPA